MKILDKIVFVYDIEVFPNCFSNILLNTENGEIQVFEVSKRTKDPEEEINKMIKIFLNKDFMFCGYNNIHYDNPIINFIIENFNTMPNDYNSICKTIFNLSKLIVESESETSVGWRRWKYAKNFATLDLLAMLFSQKLRVGLKEMQVTMQYPNVQEYEGDFNSFLPEDQIDAMLKYELNDVKSTEALLYRCKKDIDLRIGIQNEFGVDVLSKDGMSIGTEILKAKYLEKTGKSWFEIKDLRSPCDIIDLNEVIFPNIKFETPILQQLLEEMKQLKVGAGRKAYEKHLLLGGLEIVVGVGGIHSKNNPEIIIPKENEYLLDSDVNSLYPSLIISYNLVPKHLGKEFLEVYAQIREDRLYAKKHHEDIKNMTYKLALNGATGNYQNQYSWLYDPKAVLKIRINGQLFLLMLAERLIKAGAKLKQLNTDGILYTIPKDANYKEILNEWETITKLSLETEEFEAFYQYAINDYLAVGKGYKETKDKKLLKQKGLFIDRVSLGKGMSPLIIAKALNAYFADNIPIEKTIKESNDINDFLTYQKADKKFSVEYNDKLITRINRYYASTNGYYLYKCEVDKKGNRNGYINMLKASGVTIVNDLTELKEFPNNINYRYYIAECNKIITPFKQIQLKLFDV